VKRYTSEFKSTLARVNMARKKSDSRNVRISNRRARHNYHIVDTWEAGIELRGCEVKSIRDGEASLAESYARVEDGEVYLHGMYVAPYQPGSYNNPPPRRPRKLLLHRREIAKIASRSSGSGYTLVPLSLYFKRGLAKVQLALARGKREYDKREAIKKREVEREIQRALRRGARGRE
jgi:SsrA-binding protein